MKKKKDSTTMNIHIAHKNPGECSTERVIDNGLKASQDAVRDAIGEAEEIMV